MPPTGSEFCPDHMDSGSCRPRCRKSLSKVIAEGRGGRGEQKKTAYGGLTAAEVDDAWKQLLEDTLPPEKQEVLNETYEEESDPQRRYNMLMEFSSYLRQVSPPLPSPAALPTWTLLDRVSATGAVNRRTMSTTTTMPRADDRRPLSAGPLTVATPTTTPACAGRSLASCSSLVP